MQRMAQDIAADGLEAVAAMLSLVARLYRRPPTPEMIELLHQFDAEADLLMRDEEGAAGLRLIADFCRRRELQQALVETTGDHSQLFVGPMHLLAAPWSSIYMDKGFLFGPTARRVEEFIRKAGFQIPESSYEPFDHIAYELQFVAELNRKIVEKVVSDDEPKVIELLKELEYFIATFLAPWIETFLKTVENKAETDLYVGLSRVTRGIISLESDLIVALSAQN